MFNRLGGKGDSNFIIDLSELRYLDSSGLGLLLYMYTSSQKLKLDIWFSNINEEAMKFIKLTKLNGFLPIAASNEETLAYIEENGERRAKQNGIKGIIVDDKHPLLKTDNMSYKEFFIDFSQIRRSSNLLAHKAPPQIREINMLEQQISEIIKNAVKHGNKNDKNKSTKIWFSFSNKHAHLIVEDG